MPTKRLELIFQNQAGSRATISIQDPREDLATEDVMDAMNLIIARNVFTSPGGDLTDVIGARIVIRDVQDIITAA